MTTDNQMLWVNTIADLKAKPTPTVPQADGLAVEVLGYYTAGDGGGGLFQWKADSTEPYNGGTVVAKLLDTLDTFTGDGKQTEFTLTHTLQTPESLVVLVDGVDDGGVIYTYHLAGTLLELMQAPEKGVTVRIRRLSPGRWLRVYSGPLNVKWFGAKAVDSKTQSTPLEIKENTQAIQTAVNFVKVGATLYFPSGGNYRISSPISLKPCVRYLGEGVASIGDKFLPLGPYGAVLEATNGNAIFTYPSIRDIEIGYLLFCGSGGKALYQTNMAGTTRDSIIHNCIFYAELEECIYGALNGCEIDRNLFGLNVGNAGERHRHIYSYGRDAGGTNFNRITNNIFGEAKGKKLSEAGKIGGNESIYFEAGLGSLTLSGNRFEKNKAETTIRVYGLSQIHFDDNYFEENTGDYLVYLDESLPDQQDPHYKNYIVTATGNYFSSNHPADQGMFHARGKQQPVIIFKYNAGAAPAKIFTYENTNKGADPKIITDPDGSGFYPNPFVGSLASWRKIKVEHEDILVNSPWYPPEVWSQGDPSAEDLKNLLHITSKDWQPSDKLAPTIFHQTAKGGYGILKIPTTGPSGGLDHFPAVFGGPAVFFDHFIVWVRFANYADKKPEKARKFIFAYNVADAPLASFPEYFACAPAECKSMQKTTLNPGEETGFVFGINVSEKCIGPEGKAPFIYLYFAQTNWEDDWDKIDLDSGSNSGAGMTLLAIRPRRRKLLGNITPKPY